MRAYAVLLGLIGIGCLVLAGEYREYGAAFVLPALWAAESFLLTAAAYAGLGPRVFGKRPDGSMVLPHVGLLLPFLVYTWLVWHLKVALASEPAWNEVVPGLWLGRRPRHRRELPAGAKWVVDMTAEFPEPLGFRGQTEYRACPTLDYTAPELSDLQEIADFVAAHRAEGVYLHCAVGHGRSALVAAAALLADGDADDVAQAEAIVRGARERVRWNRLQRCRLEEFARARQRVPIEDMKRT